MRQRVVVLIRSLLANTIASRKGWACWSRVMSCQVRRQADQRIHSGGLQISRSWIGWHGVTWLHETI